MYLFIIAFLFLNMHTFLALPEPYASVEILPFDGHGWFCPPNQEALDAAIHRISPNVVVEVGCWLGSSTRFIAERVKPGAKVYAVDHWLGSVEHQQMPDGISHLPTLYQQFLSNVIHKKLTDVIVPVRMSSKEAFYNLDVEADLIYIDASHDAQSVYEDIVMWAKKLSPKGEIYGDDYSWPSVREGLYRAAGELNAKVESFGGQAWRLIFE